MLCVCQVPSHVFIECIALWIRLRFTLQCTRHELSETATGNLNLSNLNLSDQCNVAMWPVPMPQIPVNYVSQVR